MLTDDQSSKAAFLGDANFPVSAQKYYRDGRQTVVQELHERYSKLAFSRPTDRPIAILGLQERLSRVFQTQAAYGFFAAYFGRGLLWHRRGARRMTRLALPSSTSSSGNNHRPPSWSWFSKDGAIQYMSLKFTQIDWATGRDFENPFDRVALASAPGTEVATPSGSPIDHLTTLRGFAREMRMTTLELSAYVKFDLDTEFSVDELRCVVIGRDKAGSAGSDLRHHVLVIHPVQVGENREQHAYERAGVASLRPEFVGDRGVWVSIR